MRLGLIGDEFATARLHLLANLPGCIAWRDPAQAEAQKERLRQKREKEKEQARLEEAVAGSIGAITEQTPQAGGMEDPPAFVMRM